VFMVSARFQAANRSPEVPKLILELESWPRVFACNMRDFLLRRGPHPDNTVASDAFWPDVFVSQTIPVAAMRQSLLWHVFFVVTVWGLTITWLNHRPVQFESFPAKQAVAYYSVSEYLPQIGTPAPPAPIAKKGEPEFSPQPIISVPLLPDNARQTIVDPSTTKVLPNDAKLPNLVAWNNIPAAPIAAGARSASQVTLPWHAPTPVAPAPENADRRISDLIARAPAPSIVQPAPSDEALNRKLGELNVAESATAVAPPKLEVPAQRASGEAAKSEIPAAPDVQGVSGASGAGQLIALNVRPEAPTGPIQSPGGNRSGVFAATPEGKPGASGTPDIVGGIQGAGSGVAGHDVTSVPDGIYVGPPAAPPGAVGGKPSLNADQKKILMAGMMHSSPMANSLRRTDPTIEAPSKAHIEDEVFGSKKYYSMILNMPNLTSAGGSWIVRYAELKQNAGEGELVPPTAVQKADPAYPAEAIRGGVEGTVILYAVIHSDGRVSNVRVLRSVDERLDASACTALTHWQFRPATKGGTPVALETVVHIPFALPKNGF